MSLRIALFTLPGPGDAALAALREAGHTVGAVVVDPRDAASPFAASAAGAGAEVLAPADLGAIAGRLKDLAPDIVAVASFDRKIPAALRAAGRRAALNVHPSLLPRWRGHNPYFWVIARGEAETGVTVHHLTDEIDAGPIVHRRVFPLAGDETLGTLYAALSRLGAQALVEALAVLEAQGGLPAIPQPAGDWPRARRVRPADWRLEWARPAADLERIVRAANPYYGATGDLLGVPVQIWEADVVGTTTGGTSGAPGEVLAFNGRIAIGTGAGLLVPRVMGIAGEFIGSAESFVRRGTGRGAL